MRKKAQQKVRIHAFASASFVDLATVDGMSILTTYNRCIRSSSTYLYSNMVQRDETGPPTGTLVQDQTNLRP